MSANLEPLLIAARRRAVLLVLRAHPEWTFDDLVRLRDQDGPGAQVLRTLTLGELLAEPEPPIDDGPPVDLARLQRAGSLGGEDFDACVTRYTRARGLPVTVNTTLTPAGLASLEDLFEPLIAAGVETWQIGINVAMGRAADEPERLLQPYDLLELMPRLAALARAGRARGLALMPGNTVGYFGPDEALLRFAGDERRPWTGCNAGRNGMGIESDGTIKACPSLPREDYAAGNVRERSIAQMWAESDAIRFPRTRTVEDLWGFCRTFEYAADCLAGCSWVSHSFLGRPGNNPYCHHRALALDRRGLRERIERIAAPPGEPFDLGEFALYLESRDGQRSQRQVPPAWTRPNTGTRAEREPPRRLFRCPACSRYSAAGEGVCERCGHDLVAANIERAAALRQAREALVRLRVLCR